MLRPSLVGDGKQRIQPVHVSDVVATVLHCLHVVPTQRTLDVVGGVCWLPVVWLQIRMRNLADTALISQTALPFAPIRRMSDAHSLVSSWMFSWVLLMLMSINTIPVFG